MCIHVQLTYGPESKNTIKKLISKTLDLIINTGKRKSMSILWKIFLKRDFKKKKNQKPKTCRLSWLVGPLVTVLGDRGMWISEFQGQPGQIPCLEKQTTNKQSLLSSQLQESCFLGRHQPKRASSPLLSCPVEWKTLTQLEREGNSMQTVLRG